MPRPSSRWKRRPQQPARVGPDQTHARCAGNIGELLRRGKVSITAAGAEAMRQHQRMVAATGATLAQNGGTGGRGCGNQGEIDALGQIGHLGVAGFAEHLLVFGVHCVGTTCVRVRAQPLPDGTTEAALALRGTDHRH